VARAHIFERCGPDRLLLHPLEKLAGEVEAHIGFEKDAPDLPEPFFDRVFGEDTSPHELLERGVQLTRKLFEHKPLKVAGIRCFNKADRFPSQGIRHLRQRCVVLWDRLSYCDHDFSGAMVSNANRRDPNARSKWPVRIYRLGDEPGDDLSAATTPDQRLEMVAVLSKRMWELSGRPIPRYQRNQMPGRVIRRG